MGIVFWDAVHFDCSQRPFQKAPHPLEPEVSVNSCISELGGQYVLRMKEVPDQVGRKSFHQARSCLASSVIARWWWGCWTVMLRSIKRHKKMRPAGTTLHANDKFPMSERSWCLIRLRWPEEEQFFQNGGFTVISYAGWHGYGINYYAQKCCPSCGKHNFFRLNWGINALT